MKANMGTLAFLSLLSMAIAGGAVAQGRDVGKMQRSKEDVRMELVQSRHDGTSQLRNGEYPPGEQTVKQNKSSHAAAVHAKEGPNPSVDRHDDPQMRSGNAKRGGS